MLLGKNTIGTVAYMGGVMALPEPFVWSWSQMMEYSNEHVVNHLTERIKYDRATVSYHSFARNTLVNHMDGKWLLMLDTDHQFDPDLLGRMLLLMNKHDVDILAAPYVFKSPPYAPVVFGYNPKTKSRFVLGSWQKDVDLIQIHSVGAGALLVKRTVFDQVKEKFKVDPFTIYYDKNGITYSEDHSFFERCMLLGIKAYFAPNIEAKHLIYRALSVNEDYPMHKMKTKRQTRVETFK